MFGQFTGEKEPDSGLDLPGGDGGPLVVVGQFGSLGSDTLEEIIHKGVHDAHRFGGDTGVGVDLFQHLKDKKKGLFKKYLVLVEEEGLNFGSTKHSETIDHTN